MTASPRLNHYRVIYADPPWTFSTYSRKGRAAAPKPITTACRSPTSRRCRWPSGRRRIACCCCGPPIRCCLQRSTCSLHGGSPKNVGFYWAKLNKSADPSIYRGASFFTGLGFWTRAKPEMACWRPAAIRHRREAERAQADRLAAARAQPQAGRGLRAHREAVRGALSGNVRAVVAARLGQMGRRNPICAISGRGVGAPTVIPTPRRPRIRWPRARQLH